MIDFEAAPPADRRLRAEDDILALINANRLILKLLVSILLSKSDPATAVAFAESLRRSSRQTRLSSLSGYAGAVDPDQALRVAQRQTVVIDHFASQVIEEAAKMRAVMERGA